MSTQPDTMREAFEAFVLSKPGANSLTICRRDFPGSDRIGEYVSSSVEFGWLSWQAATVQATAAERERCALRFESLSNELYDADKHAAAIRAGEALGGRQ